VTWYSYPNGKKERRFYTLIDYGTEEASSMAKLVGVPCAVAVDMILKKEITQTGVFGPLTVDLARPLMAKLEALGIKMKEHILELQ
jgi:saccharopine dehydrogenase-like NADP-dependent oxidoreductase